MVKRPVLVFTGERAETRTIGSYVGATRTATVEPPFAQTPSSGSLYRVDDPV
jgi:hypothetical protein